MATTSSSDGQSEFEVWARGMTDWRYSMWKWAESEKGRLSEIRRAYWRGEHRYWEDSVEECRLRFGRWLREHGRIGDDGGGGGDDGQTPGATPGTATGAVDVEASE